MDFFDVKGEKKGLGYYSEQVFESVHHDFKVFEENSSVHFEHKRFKEMQLKPLYQMQQPADVDFFIMCKIYMYAKFIYVICL